MTNTRDIYNAEQLPEKGSIERFYYDKNAKTVEEKISALEKQLREHPHHNVPRDRRLKQLQFKWNRLRADTAEQVKQTSEDKKKWQDKYKEVNDDKNSIDNTISPVDMAMLNGSIRIERDYD